MGQKTAKETIGGVVYQVTQVDAEQSRKIQRRIALVGGSLLPLALNGTIEGAAGVASMVTTLARVLSDEDLAFVIDTLAAQTLFQEPGFGMRSLSDHYKQHFAGAAVQHAKWLWFALRVNYMDFIAELGLNVAAPEFLAL